MIRQTFDYYDLLLLPQYSELSSRTEADLSTSLDSYLQLDVPIISAAMDTVTEEAMAQFMAIHGALGIIHRYMPIDQQCLLAGQIKRKQLKIGVSTGSADWKRIQLLCETKVDLLAFDVAHGDSARVLTTITDTKYRYPNTLILSGNVCTVEGAKRSVGAGADIIRVGIGPGSACTTRQVCGVGIGQLSAIMDIHKELGGYPIVADGGIKNSGDIVKALAAGADAVMVGKLLAGYTETPRSGYRGMASFDALYNQKRNLSVIPEGSVEQVNPVSDSELHFARIVGGIKHGFAYLGAHNIKELRENAEWVSVTSI